MTGTVTASDEVWANVIALSDLFIQKKCKLLISFFPNYLHVLQLLLLLLLLLLFTCVSLIFFSLAG